MPSNFFLIIFIMNYKVLNGIETSTSV